MSAAAATFANTVWRLACEPARRRLRLALQRPEMAQAAALQRILRRQEGTMFAKKHGLRVGMSVGDFQRAVPMEDYDAFETWIERMKAGEADVLCPGRPEAFERSSGSTAAAKYVPLTAGLRSEFQEAVRAWMADLFARHSQAARGPAWWLISPLRQPGEKTPGGIPVGLTSDDEYLGRWERKLAGCLWAVPPALGELADLDENLDWTLRYLLQAPELRLVSVWNPSYLSLLWQRFLERKKNLLRQLAEGTGPSMRPLLAAKLRAMPELAARLKREGELRPEMVWPRLAIISAWADAEAAPEAARTRELFPQARFQPKGLLATEGVVTIPWGDDQAAGVPALNSHFLEFVEWPEGAIRLVHELASGRDYAVLLTTSGGLWRYRLGDLVRVEGWEGETPRLRFVGRCDQVCDLCGEKLNPQFVADALSGKVAGFRLLAPCRQAGNPRYILFVQGPPPEAASVDAELCANPHYAHARAAGQLQQVRVFQVADPNPEAVYLRRCVELGQRAGSIKATVLHQASGWESYFAGHFVDEEVMA